MLTSIICSLEINGMRGGRGIERDGEDGESEEGILIQLIGG